jgi:hypothetical protein
MKIALAFLSALIAIAALSFVQPASANLVSNPGFETGDFTGWTQFGNTGFTGVSPINPHSGSFEATFGPVGSSGGIFQDLSTMGGTSYDLTFWLATGGTPPSHFEVSWNGVTIAGSIIDNPHVFEYTEFSFTGLLATGPSTELRFTFLQDFWQLDDVSVNAAAATPEAFSTIWLAIPLIGMIGFRRLYAKSA